MLQQNFVPVKIGVIGLGRFGRLHALTLANLPAAELVALVARRQESLDSLAQELPGIPGWTDLDRAIEEAQAEAWIVACTTSSHVSVARRLLENGKHVLLEKPISDNLEEARSLAKYVQSGSSQLMIGHIVLFNSEYQQLCEAARERGPISFIDCVRHRPSNIVRDFRREKFSRCSMADDVHNR